MCKAKNLSPGRKERKEKRGEKKLFKSYMKNKSWKSCCEEAPSDACGALIRLVFVREAMEWDEFVEKSDSAQEKLDVQDCEYLMQYVVGTPRRLWYKKRIAELKAKEEK